MLGTDYKRLCVLVIHGTPYDSRAKKYIYFTRILSNAHEFST